MKLIDEAQHALVAAKKKGGNRVMCSNEKGKFLDASSTQVADNIATLLRLHRHQSASAQAKLAKPKPTKSPSA